MSEPPVSITAACMRAILAGRKSQMRVVAPVSSPLGGPGDALWIREPWNLLPPLFDTVALPNDGRPHGVRVLYEADLSPHPDGAPWLPARLMPRWASRLTAGITSIRLERLQAIGEHDLIAEGGMWRETSPADRSESDLEGFIRWWNAVHGDERVQWERDPLVWVINIMVLS